MAEGDPEAIEAISAHIEAHVGPVETVFHEIISSTVHVDIHHVPPTKGRRFHALVTSGMSDLPMQVPEGLEELAYAELVVLLPPEWPVSQDAFRDERNYWPIRTLKTLARFPHEYGTWLGVDHTVPNGDPSEPYADGTGLCGVILAPATSLPEEFFTLDAGRKRVHFLALVPLYADEMQLKLDRGPEALFERLDQHGVSDVIDVQRKNVCARRSWWPFGR